VTLSQQRDHLFDLDDLLGGAAQKAEQGLAKGLAEDPQVGKGTEALRQMGVAAPGQGIGHTRPIEPTPEVERQGISHLSDLAYGSPPFQLAIL